MEEKHLASKTLLARRRMRVPSRVGRLFSRYPHLAGLVGTVVSLSMAGLSIATLYDGRSVALAHASETSTNVVSVISGDIARNVELVSLSLQAMVDGAEQPSVMALPAAIRREVLFDRSTTALHLGGAFVMDRSGTIIAAGDHNAAHPGLFEDRDYFRAHERSASTGLFISHPYRSRLRNGCCSVALTRRIDGNDGAFAGIAVVALHTDYFQSLLEKVNVGPAGSAFIVMEDGTLLARKPFVESAIGRRVPGSFPMMATRASGSYTATSSIDGVRRIFTYAHVPGTPFIVGVAPAEQDVLHAWSTRSAAVGALTVMFGAIIAGLSWTLALILRERVAAQAELVRLAGTDTLTGLHNRRVLDSRLQEEWRRARRNSMPLSVLFVDIDSFKSYNDTYGHAKGDEALVAVADCIASTIRRPGDLAVRYGGEEFVIILPDAPPEATLELAEQLRERVASMNMPHTGSALGVVTVSVGCATGYPRLGGDAFSVLREGDEALYYAKANGRNQVRAVADLGPAWKHRKAARTRNR